METAFGYKAAAADIDSGVRAADRWGEAARANLRRKKIPRKEGGRTDQREARIEQAIVEARRDTRSSHVICPDCNTPYSRGHIARHRRDVHNVVNRRGVMQNYIPSGKPVKIKQVVLLCPDCSAHIVYHSMARHRRTVHGTSAPRSYHAGYQRV